MFDKLRTSIPFIVPLNACWLKLVSAMHVELVASQGSEMLAKALTQKATKKMPMMQSL